MEIICVSRQFSLSVPNTVGFLMMGHHRACTGGIKTHENSPMFLRLLAANICDKREQAYNYYLGKLENKTNIFTKSRVICGLVPCLSSTKLKVISWVWGSTFVYLSEKVSGCEFFSL